MSISDALKFEGFNLKKIWEGLKDDPKRIFLGVDPLSTEGWNAILGRDDKSIVGHLGRPTDETFREAEARGIDTGTAKGLHNIATAIAGAYGTAGIAGGLGGGATNGFNLSQIGSGQAANSALAGAGFGGTAGGGVAPAAVGGATAAGAGGGATGGGATAGGTGGSSGGFDWKGFLQQGGQMMQQQGAQQQNEEEQLLEALARRGPPPAQGGTNVGPVPIDQYRATMSPVAAALG